MSLVSSCRNNPKIINLRSKYQTTFPVSRTKFSFLVSDSVVERILLNVTTYNFTLLISLIKYIEDFVFNISSQEINYACGINEIKSNETHGRGLFYPFYYILVNLILIIDLFSIPCMLNG